jgi:fucose permease
VGTQIISIDTIILYGQSMGLGLLDAKWFPSYTLTATIIGYLCGLVLVPRFITHTNTLKVCTITGLIFSIFILFVPGQMMYRGQEIGISIWFVMLLGLPNSLVYASIWPLAIRELGRFTKSGAALLVTALSGNGIFLLIYGHFADTIGRHAAY